MANKAAWLSSKHAHPLNIDSSPMPDAGEKLITIRVHATAINPVDSAIQTLGLIVEEYPAILGCDAAGEVTAVGSKVTSFKVGDRVTGSCDHAEDLLGKGTFQLYCNLRPELTGKISDNVEYKDACVLPLGINTACFGLFEKTTLALPFPQAEPKDIGKTVLIWGGSSSVGSCAIQAAKAAGCKVAATASAHNLEYCKGIGADWAFDHKSEGIVEDVVEALTGCDFAGAVSILLREWERRTRLTCSRTSSIVSWLQTLTSNARRLCISSAVTRWSNPFFQSRCPGTGTYRMA